MSKKRIILIDDEANSLDILEYELQVVNPDFEIVAKCSDARKAGALIDKEQPDFVFLDIEMPWLSGFEVLDQLTFLDFHLIFVTAYEQHAIKAFKYLAVDYLLKPVSRLELFKTFERIKEKNAKHQSVELKKIISLVKGGGLTSEKIPFSTQKGIEFYHPSDIVHCKADSNYTEIHTISGKKMIVSKTLKNIENLLYHNQFFRVHQSHLVNLDYLVSYIKEDGGYLKMTNGNIIPLSRSRKALFLERIHKDPE